MNKKVNERLLYQTSKRNVKVNSPVRHSFRAFASKHIGDGQLDLNTDA